MFVRVFVPGITTQHRVRAVTDPWFWLSVSGCCAFVWANQKFWLLKKKAGRLSTVHEHILVCVPSVVSCIAWCHSKFNLWCSLLVNFSSLCTKMPCCIRINLLQQILSERGSRKLWVVQKSCICYKTWYIREAVHEMQLTFRRYFLIQSSVQVLPVIWLELFLSLARKFNVECQISSLAEQPPSP